MHVQNRVILYIFDNSNGKIFQLLLYLSLNNFNTCILSVENNIYIS